MPSPAHNFPTLKKYLHPLTGPSRVTGGYDVVFIPSVFSAKTTNSDKYNSGKPFPKHNGQKTFTVDKEEDTYGLWITNGKGINIGASKTYELLSGLRADEFIGLHMSEMVRQKVLDNSVTLRVLAENRPATITQTILTNQRKLFATGIPVYDQDGNIILVVTTVKAGVELKEKTINVNSGKYVPGIEKVVTTSAAMKKVMTKAARAACFDSTVIITGESGVGKEVIAKLIHHMSRRNIGPFINVNVGAIPGELFESELFGYRSGAFTGAAHSGKKGLVKAATGGTLFLDEISELPLFMQVKLLHLLQEREYLPVGAVHPEKADVRFIAATNRNLRQLVEEGKFREDLFYRLNVIPIEIPPLRDRMEDIYALSNHFLQRMKNDYQVKKFFTADALSKLISYKWPGNVRELENLIERFIVLYPDIKITSNIVEEELGLFNSTPDLNINDLEFPNLQKSVAEFEKRIILKTIDKTNSLEEAANSLGIHRTTLIRKIQKYKLNTQIT
ncbi:sigma-54 interaction domain-containing protein [Desulfotomaculum copahuensis]|uniref:sigma-54 interaction domain-containing protein n=1 Tax=Desulfotomaculum copahuensis TaxID=1838280 RepID=UPI000AE4A301|nr:sigma 54-interacting transcriptional regulator [Desulfotomaculum copahuensis]